MAENTRSNLGDVLNFTKLKGQYFTNIQHSNNSGKMYRILRVINGLCCVELEVQYEDGITEIFPLNVARDDLLVSSSQLEQETAKSAQTPSLKDLDKSGYTRNPSSSVENC